MGEGDLEFVWSDDRSADPAAQAKIIDTYVRGGIYAINEARDLLGLPPVPGGNVPMIYGTQGAVSLGVAIMAPAEVRRRANGECVPSCGCDGGAQDVLLPFRKYNPDTESEPRVPKHQPGGGEWTGNSGGAEFDVAASGRTPCDGFSGGCQSGGSYGSSALYHILGRNLCTDCATKFLGLENETPAMKLQELGKYIIDPE
jgi:hypothetical protein